MTRPGGRCWPVNHRALSPERGCTTPDVIQQIPQDPCDKPGGGIASSSRRVYASRRVRGARGVLQSHSAGHASISLLLGICVGFGLGVWKHSWATETWRSLRQETPTSTTSTPPITLIEDPFALKQAELSVVRLDSVVCDPEREGGTGTGFLIGPRLVVTAAHVIESASNVLVHNREEVRVGTRVLGIEEARDLALLELDRDFTGVVPFQMAEQRVPTETEVSALGYAFGRGLSDTKGVVKGYDVKVPTDERAVTDLVQTSAGINPGNSGGPLVTKEGTVVGVVVGSLGDADDFAFAVDATVAAPLLQQWRRSPMQLRDVECPDPVAPTDGSGVAVGRSVSGRSVAEIAVALGIHFDALNNGQYKLAWQQFSAEQRSRVPVTKLETETRSSQTSNWIIESISQEPDGLIRVHLNFRSTQAPGKGPTRDPQETCTEWSNYYWMKFEESRWVIDVDPSTRTVRDSSAPCDVP